MSPPQRFYLITYPRTASNLLVRMLALEEQPNMASGHDRGGYIFLPVVKLMTDMNLRQKSIHDWTDDEVMQVKGAYQQCFDEFQRTLNRVSDSQHSIYVKEHVHFLIDPATLSEYVFGSNPDRAAAAASNYSASMWTLGQLRSDRSSDDNDYGPDCLSTSPRDGNITLLPDEFLLSWKPTFLIRHPALAFPSLYRALLALEATGDESADGALGQHCMTLCWTRRLYDWYKEKHRRRDDWPSSHRAAAGAGGSIKWPIVLDADDIMASPDLAVKYSGLLGMDPRKLSFSWEPASDGEVSHLSPATRRYLDTLLASGGVLTEKLSGAVCLDSLAKEWQREFGPRVGDRIARLVGEAMPDYEFLKARRLIA